MKSLNGLGLGLSIVFGCLFLALVAEVYYLLWWKRRITNRDLEDGYSSTSTVKEFFNLSCWKKPPSLRPLKLNSQQFGSSHEILVHEPQSQANSSTDSWVQMPYGENSVEAELMRLHNFSCPPRFLFTIKEETKEDLESEDGKSRGDSRSRKGSRGRSLSDLFHVVETPYLTPIASPPYYTPPLTPVNASHSHNNNQQGFNSFFGSESEAEFNWLLSSPPPMFKFLRDAEDKLCRRKFREEIDQEYGHKFDVPSTSTIVKDEENGSFITLIVNRKNQEELNDDQLENMFQFPYNTSRVLPLASSPPPLKLNSIIP